MADRKLREAADDYTHIVSRLSDRWRVIRCSARLQWIMQCRDGQRAGGARWTGVGYFLIREALLRLCRASVARIDPAAWAALIALPDHFMGAWASPRREAVIRRLRAALAEAEAPLIDDTETEFPALRRRCPPVA